MSSVHRLSPSLQTTRRPILQFTPNESNSYASSPSKDYISLSVGYHESSLRTSPSPNQSVQQRGASLPDAIAVPESENIRPDDHQVSGFNCCDSFATQAPSLSDRLQHALPRDSHISLSMSAQFERTELCKSSSISTTTLNLDLKIETPEKLAPIQNRTFEDDICDNVPNSSTPDLSGESASFSDDTSPALTTPSRAEFTRSLDQRLSELLQRPREVENREILNEEGAYNDWVVCSPGAERSEDNVSSLETNPFSPYNDNSEVSRSHSLSLSSASQSKTGCQSKRKRGSSSSADDADTESTEVDTDVDTDTENDEAETTIKKSSNLSPRGPVGKKLKHCGPETSFVYDTTIAASSRRAHSLKSSVLSSLDSEASLVSTDVAAPVHPPHWDHISSLPILAPPEYVAIPRAPITAEDAAEVRIMALLTRERSCRIADGLHGGAMNASSKDNNFTFGIENNFRRKVVRWLLNVLPSRKLRLYELRGHLLHSNETRIHAVLLFSRYFATVGDGMPLASKTETELMMRGRERIVWNVAVACLALAVKFHRDFLFPLSPIYAREFLDIAPHTMSHDEFEISQKGVLEAVRYEIRGATPEPFVDEIWRCLSTLRKLLDFEDGWQVAQTYAWEKLRAASLDADILRFPISVVTAAAIFEGIAESLITKYECDAEKQKKPLAEEVEHELEDRALKAMRGIVEDLKDLLKITKADLRDCRCWLSSLPFDSE